MKKILILISIIMALIPSLIYGQKNLMCAESDPICTGPTYTYPAGTTGSAEAGAYYDCLSTQPAPAWFHMLIETSGSISLYMYSTPLVDVDFICWGPFTDPYDPCVQGLTQSKVVDCSYSPNPTEYCDIPNGQTGEYYILMITNYSQQPASITFSQTAGSGTLDCSIAGGLDADFSASPLVGQFPLFVQFSDISSGNPTSWQWDFQNDGIYDSYLQNPTFTYNQAGTYSVKLLVQNNTGEDIEIKISYITVTQDWTCGAIINYGGQNYNTIQLGTQCWMAENLNVGTQINTAYEQTNNNLIEKYCYNNSADSCNIYGGLYQWNEMMQYVADSGAQGICPSGWHIATASEWNILESYIEQPNIGKKLQALGNPCINDGCEDLGESGFNALLGGLRYYNGSSMGIGEAGDFWTSSESNSGYPYTYKQVHKTFPYVNTQAIYGSRGFSVRCIKDEEIIGLNSDFSASPLQGLAPLNVQFTDESTGNPTIWKWDFQNDGIYDSFIQNPSFTYSQAGNYSVKLFIQNQTDSASEIKYNYITVNQNWECGIGINYGGQNYSTIQIGTQCWMGENLNVGTRINGSQEQSNNSIIEKYCYNDLLTNCNIYGGLYQWNEAMNYVTTEGAQGICPTGWHIATDSEWSTLINFLGGENIAGGALKETGTNHWNPPNSGATNSSGFTGLPGAYRYLNGTFGNIGYDADFWTSTQFSSTDSWARWLYYNSTEVGHYDNLIENGFSIRCIQNSDIGALNANFSAIPLEGYAPLSVQFIDESTGNPSVWIWDFQNDGINDAYIQNPTYVYEEPGSYSVKLIVIDSVEADTIVKEDYISVNQGSGECLIAYYPFNGNANDESGNGNNGNVLGATLTEDRFGNPNSAYSFDGINDYIDLGNSSLVSGEDAITVSTWTYYISEGRIIGSGNQNDFAMTQLDQTDSIAISIHTDGNPEVYQILTSSEYIIENEWNNIVLRYNGSSLDLFTNGWIAGSIPASGNIYSWQADYLSIGTYMVNGNPYGLYYNGKLDDIRIYNCALSDEEIIELYNEDQIAIPELCIVSVTTNDHNQIIWEKQLTDQIATYNVYRETTQNNVFEIIGTVAYEDTSIFVDISSNPQQRPYKYKLSAVSVSENETALSNYHKTIHLTINQGPSGWNLIWSPYEGFPFTTYYIYRGFYQDDLSLLDSISSSFTSYTDINPPWGPLYYAIEIVNEEGCSPNKDGEYDRSRSNIIYNGVVGYKENSETDIKIFPNPAKENLNIEFSNKGIVMDGQLIIMDLSGKEVLIENLNSPKTIIDIKKLVAGVYFIVVNSNKICLKRKLLIY